VFLLLSIVHSARSCFRDSASRESASQVHGQGGRKSSSRVLTPPAVQTAAAIALQAPVLAPVLEAAPRDAVVVVALGNFVPDPVSQARSERAYRAR
jgi:hypothetical protein